jgi:diguanylate cyclase (GGDEF)-like protein
MSQKYNTLIDRLNNIVDTVHIDEVKKIINTLSKISNFKSSIEDDLCTDTLYDKILYELKNEFGISDFKIILFSNNIETILYKYGNIDNLNYHFSSRVSNNSKIAFMLNDGNLTSYEKLTLHSYFNELIQLLYIQIVLTDLQKSSTVDSLTQLESRLSFTQEMKILIPLALREKMSIGVLLINIDRFRAVNDEHGDEFGDKFLQLYAKTIKETIRTSDIAVRFGGGEFLVLLVNIDTENRVIELATNLKEKLALSYLKTKNGDKFRKTVCIGVSMFPEDSTDINEIIKNSEIALSDARDEKRDNILRYKKPEDGEIDFF